MVGTKIIPPKDRRHQNNLPKGGSDEELDGRHENNSPNGWMAQGTRQRDERMDS